MTTAVPASNRHGRQSPPFIRAAILLGVLAVYAVAPSCDAWLTPSCHTRPTSSASAPRCPNRHASPAASAGVSVASVQRPPGAPRRSPLFVSSVPQIASQPTDRNGHEDGDSSFESQSRTVRHSSTETDPSSTDKPAIQPPSSGLPTRIDPEQTHVLVLPGFATSADDYLHDLVPNLAQQAVAAGWWKVGDPVGQRNHNDTDVNHRTRDTRMPSTKKALQHIHVLPLQRHEWLQTIVHGMLDPDFITAQAPPTKWPYRWYLQKVAAEIRRIQHLAKANGTQAKIILVGHSAGGWLARAAVGYGTDATYGKDLSIDIDSVLGIVTLGSPHIPCPKGCVDITGGALRIVHDKFPGAFFKDRLFYVSAAGTALDVAPEVVPPSSATSPTNALQSHSHVSVAQQRLRNNTRKLAYRSYKLLSGNGHHKGDGIVPVTLAHLEGSNLQITLENVWHTSMLHRQEQIHHQAQQQQQQQQQLRNRRTDQQRQRLAQATQTRWYGSKEIVQQWFRPILHTILSSTLN